MESQMTVDAGELEQLLVATGKHDVHAFRELYDQVSPKLLGILLRMLGNRANAEDALQDVFVKIWERAGQFDRFKGRAMAWLVAIARNQAVDWHRGARPMLMIDSAGLAEAEQLQVAGPAESAEFGATARALNHCLELLNEAQRRCVLLAYNQGLTQERIAQLTKQPLGSVKSWVRRGLQSLKGCMES